MYPIHASIVDHVLCLGVWHVAWEGGEFKFAIHRRQRVICTVGTCICPLMDTQCRCMTEVDISIAGVEGCAVVD